MKFRMFVTLLVFALCLPSLAQESEQKEKNKKKPKVQLVTFEIINDDFDMTFTETKREKDYSIAKVRHGKGMSVPSSMFLMYGVWKIAKERKAKYFWNVQDYEDSVGENWKVRPTFSTIRKFP